MVLQDVINQLVINQLLTEMIVFGLHRNLLTKTVYC